MKHILIFGANGFIGGCLAREAHKSGWKTTTVSRSPSIVLPGVQHEVCDITEPKRVEQILETIKPDAVANLAAVANIDRAEIERGVTYQVNVNGPANLSRICSQSNIRFIHFTSDAVFDGTLPIIKETDPPNPLNYYGYTKALGDAEVMRENPRSAILRISLALGFPIHNGNSFLTMLKSRLSECTPVYAPETEIRTPVDIYTLCAAVLEIAEKSFSGLLNIGATASIDRYTLTTRITQKLGFSESLILRTGQPVPGRAPRHRLGILDVHLAQQVLQTPILDIEETIDRAVL